MNKTKKRVLLKEINPKSAHSARVVGRVLDKASKNGKITFNSAA